MPQVTYFGRTAEVTEDYFLFLVQGAVAGAYSLAQGLFEGYNEGSVDDTERKGSPAPQILAQLWMLVEQIDDPELRGLVEGFHGQVRRIVDFNDDLLVAVAAFVNLPPPQDRRDRQRLRRRLRKYDSVGPRWLPQTSFQRVLEEAAGVYRALKANKRRIGARLGQLRAGLGRDQASALAERAACLLVEDTARGAGWDAIILCRRLQSCFADISGQWSTLIREDSEGLRTLLPQIRDEELARLVKGLSSEIERIGGLNEQLLKEVSRFFGLAPPVDEPGREELWRRLAQYDTIIPTWMRDPRFEELTKEAQREGRPLERSVHQIAKHAELRARAPNQPASQRAIPSTDAAG